MEKGSQNGPATGKGRPRGLYPRPLSHTQGLPHGNTWYQHLVWVWGLNVHLWGLTRWDAQTLRTGHRAAWATCQKQEHIHPEGRCRHLSQLASHPKRHQSKNDQTGGTRRTNETKLMTMPRLALPRHQKLEPEKLLVCLKFLDLFVFSVIYFLGKSLQSMTSKCTASQTTDRGFS